MALGAASAAPLTAETTTDSGENSCAECHTESDLWSQDTMRLYVPQENLKADVHWLHGVKCRDCHGGNAESTDVKEAHAGESGFRSLADVKKACADCHQKQSQEIVKSVHAAVGEEGKRIGGAPLECAACHGKNEHKLLPVENPNSPVFGANQVQTCGVCHEDHRRSYLDSVHGRGLDLMGLSSVAVCANCHDAHGIFFAADSRSTIFPANVAATCSKCHRTIEGLLRKSVHARKAGGAEKAGSSAGKIEPTCISCHPGHTPPLSGSWPVRLREAAVCGNCHIEETTGFALHAHVALTNRGYVLAANCPDCHGTHDVLPASDPDSTLSAEHRPRTCGQCHPLMLGSYVDFNPHVSYENAARNPVICRVYDVFLNVLIWTFGIFVVHCFAWFLRSMIDVLQNGRPQGLRAGAAAYVRFGFFPRISHLVLMAAFFMLTLTGLLMKYSREAWTGELAAWLGGFNSIRFWHRMAGVAAFGCLLGYSIFWVRCGSWRRKGFRMFLRDMFGPDSPVPNFHDLKNFGCVLLWFVGLRPRPTFERWAYWEKFDFWAVWGNVILIGGTGIIIWFPNLFCCFLPVAVLEIAKVVHYSQALLATGFLMAVHFFNAHLRPEKFPLDTAIFSGLVSADALQKERPEYFCRLETEGRLDRLRTAAPSRTRLVLIWFAGLLVMAAELGLLAAMIWAGLGV